MKTATYARIVLFVAIALGGCAQDSIAPAGPATRGMEWTSQADNWLDEKAKLQALGEQFEDSWALYEKLRSDAQGGHALKAADLALPGYDWSGIFTRTKGGLQFDPDLDPRSGPESAQLTVAASDALQIKRDQIARTGGEYDPISDCRPPGVPRWLTEPFLHEFIVTPQQTLLINEMVNDIRRVYTDGRDHTPEEDAYPSWNGDTIGFWDGDVLTMHTKFLNSGQYQRGVQPDYSEQTTLVERWRKVDEKTIQADVWVFDPVNLTRPWYTRQSWTKLTNDDYTLRIRYWDCRENSNNEILRKDDGTSQFKDFDFVTDDASSSNDAAVKNAQNPVGLPEQP